MKFESPERTCPAPSPSAVLFPAFCISPPTLTLLIAVNRSDISVLQGIVQAVSAHCRARRRGLDCCAFRADAEHLDRGNWLRVARRFGADPLCRRSRFLSAGLDGQTPSAYATPYAALDHFTAVSMILVVIEFSRRGVQETFQRLLSLAVVLQLVPFLYMFIGLAEICPRR